MQVNSPSSSRAAWYDRNAVTIMQEFQVNGIGPHPLTIRWSYTVPTGRKANIEVTTLNVIRVTAATSIELYNAQIYMASASPSHAYCGYIVSIDNTPPVIQSVNVTPTMTLYEGDAMHGADGDGSTGGIVTYQTSMKGSEFDA